MAERVTAAAAARALAINKSTLSRYLRQHPGLLHDGGVDVEEVRAHRAGNVNQAMAKNWQGHLAEDAAPEPALPARSSLQDARTKNAEAQAQMRQIDLEVRKATLVARAEVEEAAREAGRLMQDGLRSRNVRLADRLVTMDDPREIRALLDAEDRLLMETIANAVGQRLADAA